MASRYRAAQSRLRRFEQAGAPEEPRASSRSPCGSRAGVPVSGSAPARAWPATGSPPRSTSRSSTGNGSPSSGPNGWGKSHFLRLLAGDAGVGHTGSFRLGARIVPGYFVQTHAHPELLGRTAREIRQAEHDLDRGRTMGALRRYELHHASERRFEEISGGQQARLMILRLELSGTTALLLDEPTDTLDLESAEALQDALDSYDGTALCVTHDRWFARSFDRFLIFGSDGTVDESPEPVSDPRTSLHGRRP